jgi:M6 family metalloprotease-like protein
VQRRRAQQAEKVNIKPNLAPRGLLILVNFQNKEFVTPYETLLDMLDGDNYSRSYTYQYTYEGKTYTEKVSCSGSARKYFQDQSYGQYSPVFDVVGPYTLSQNYAYYGGNNDQNAPLMIKEACELADQNGADFTLYDHNEDGYVDFVYVIYAGYGEADGGPSETVWPHNSELSPNKWWGIKCEVDGKLVNNYACSNEISYTSGVYNGIGTFCHEFSHVLGLPDLYYTSSSGTAPHTLLEWDILDYGPYNNDGNTPPAYSAYERFFMGWLTPRVLDDPEYVWLNPLNFQNGMSILICEGGQHNLIGYDPQPRVFYLLEARTKLGWDKYLPGGGLLITKISYDPDKWYNNTVNNDAKNMGVDLLEAKPNKTLYALRTDAYPAGAEEWTSFADHEVTSIKTQNGGSVTFCYRYAEEQGVEIVESGASKVESRKVLRDGQIYLMYNGKMYNVQGQEVK